MQINFKILFVTSVVLLVTVNGQNEAVTSVADVAKPAEGQELAEIDDNFPFAYMPAFMVQFFRPFSFMFDDFQHPFGGDFMSSFNAFDGFLSRHPKMPAVELDAEKCLMEIDLSGLKDTSNLSVSTEGHFVTVSFSDVQKIEPSKKQKDESEAPETEEKADPVIASFSSSSGSRMFTLPETCAGNAKEAKATVDKEAKKLFVQFPKADEEEKDKPQPHHGSSTVAPVEIAPAHSGVAKKDDGSGKVNIPLVRFEEF